MDPKFRKKLLEKGTVTLPMKYIVIWIKEIYKNL